MKLRYYQGLLQGCSCCKCQQELTRLDASMGSQPQPCTYVAAAMALTVSNFTNLTPTFFRQVYIFMKSLLPFLTRFFQIPTVPYTCQIRSALPDITHHPPTQPLPNPLRLLRAQSSHCLWTQSTMWTVMGATSLLRQCQGSWSILAPFLTLRYSSLPTVSSTWLAFTRSGMMPSSWVSQL